VRGRSLDLLLVIFMLTIFSASAFGQSAAKEGTPKTIVDCFGRNITVGKPAERVIPIFYVMAEYLCVIGAREKIVGIGSVYAKNTLLDQLYPAVYNLPIVAKGSLNIEKLVELKPDLVLCSNSTKMVESIEQLGIVAFASMPRMYDDIFKQICDVGTLVGKESEAGEVVGYLKECIDKVAGKLISLPINERPSVYYLRDEPLQTMGKGVISDIIWMAGGKNVAEDIGESGNPAMVSMENIISWNPKVIVLRDRSAVSPEQLYGNPLWADIDAIKNRRIYRESYGWTEFRTETAFGIMEKARWFQPLRCGELDPAKAYKGFLELTRGFYKAPQNTNFTQMEAPRISFYHCKIDALAPRKATVFRGAL
jgi:iron complex transport system substrate-binding protein